MCGIAGIFTSKKIDNIDQRIQSMTESMKHRGPDSSGYFINSNQIALGHRRLKIIDLSEASAQPMQSSDKRYTVVFNGEIYNFLDLKRNLPNHPFQSTGDTEVILASIQVYGLDWFLNNANGMFSIAIYDSLDKSITLIRDRLGVKPLFYHINDTELIFASEIKGILSSGRVDAFLNDDAIDSYLANRYVIEPYTLFKEIFQVKAGHYIRIDCELNWQEFEYWHRPDYSYSDANEKEITNELEYLIQDAIKIRLHSDVPISTYLSGGVDSSLITAMAAIITGQKINTFTVGFNNESFNEFQYADIVAKQYNTNHHQIVLDKDDYLQEWERQIYFKDGPLGVPNEVPLALMTKELKKHASVVLSGEGADELFCGYGRIFRLPHDWLNHNHRESFLNQFILEYEYIPRSIRDQTLENNNFEIRNIQDTSTELLFKKHGNQDGIQHFFHEFHLKGLLNRLDANTMQASVEAREPFLDYRLVEFSYSKIPIDLKIKWKSEQARILAKSLIAKDYSEHLDVPKYILKKIAEKYLPNEVIYRKKMGFPVPLKEWFGDLEVIAKNYLANTVWLKPESLDTLLKVSRNSPNGGQILWMFINLEMFHRIYFERTWRW